jgi:hypothetical protein
MHTGAGNAIIQRFSEAPVLREALNPVGKAAPGKI